MKKLAISVLAAFAAGAQASYELVLVLDNSTASIHRFDGTTGAYFGEYAKGDLMPGGSYGLAVDPTRGVSYVSDSNRGMLLVHEYSTGVLLREVSLLSTVGHVANMAVAQNGDLLVAGSSRAARLNPSLVVQNYYGAGGSTNVAQAPDGTVYTTDRSGSPLLRRFTFTGAAGGTAALPAITSYFNWQSTFVGNVGYMTSTTSDSIIPFSPVNPPFAGSAVALPSVTQCFALGAGHGSTLYAAGLNPADATKGRLNVYSMATGAAFYKKTTGEGILKKPYAVATVVAPEPGTLAALSLGAWAVLRRRRKG